ncbi:hypothetical protein GE061_017358 [Apolygus lucorum]|uniref:2-oxoglutarate dehydrogenase E1 component/KDG C-terminal domain-containing protein n=1 Tax=Apolygus lucorum TaxID=248454 RepID=A0A8S9XAY9_APOLU|nr:hypothetical protein GE061_017358 [Apolygus lucorum]
MHQLSRSSRTSWRLFSRWARPNTAISVKVGRRYSSKTDIPDPFDSHFLNSITLENIKSSIRPWIIKRVDKCVFRELTFQEQAAVFNRLLMVHCFEVFLYSKYLSARRSMFDCEVVLPALCSLIDRSLINGAKSFVIGLSQLSQLTALSKLVKESEVEIFRELLQSRNDLLFDDLKEDGSCLILDEDMVSDFIEQSDKSQPYSLSLLGPPAPASAVYPLMMGRAKALQNQDKGKGSDSVWPVFCYPLADICSQDSFTNIVNILEEPGFSARGTIHMIINCEHDELDEESKYSIESSSKLIKLLADKIKAPVIHVKAEEVDSVVYVMNLVSDFRANHKRDIVVNLMGGSPPRPHKNVALAGFIKEFLIGGKDPLVTAYSKELISNKVISKWELDDRKETYLKKLVKDHANPKVVNVKKKSPVLEKRVKEPLTGINTETMSQMISLLDTVQITKNATSGPNGSRAEETSNSDDKQPFSNPAPGSRAFGNQIDWESCTSLAYATLLDEGYYVQVCRSALGPASSINDPKILVPDSRGEFKLQETLVSPFAMAGFQIGYSTTGDNILAVWEVPEEMEPSILHEIVSKYYGMGKLEEQLAVNVVFIVPCYFKVPGTEKSSLCVSSQPSQVLDVCEDCDILTGFNDQLYNCNVVVASVSSPANLFHLLRRHARSQIPKPLIVFVPDASDGASRTDELTGDTCFQPYIGDASIFESNVKNVILSTGRIHRYLGEERSRRNLNDKIALGRLEQICPFPYNNLIQDMERFPQARIWWAQEEEADDGCWNYVEARLLGLFGEERIVRFPGHYRPTSLHSPLSVTERVASIYDVILDS